MRQPGLSVVCLALALCGSNGPERAGAQVSDYHPLPVAQPVPPNSPETPPPAQAAPATQPKDWKWEPARLEANEGPIIPAQNIVGPTCGPVQCIDCPPLECIVCPSSRRLRRIGCLPSRFVECIICPSCNPASDTVRPALQPAPSIPNAARPALKPLPSSVGPPPIVEESEPKPKKPAEAPDIRVPEAPISGICIEKIGPASLSIGKPLAYEIVVRNVHRHSVRDVHLEDELPAGWRFLRAEPKARQQESSLLWELGVLEAGAERRVKVEVEPTAAGDFNACAHVTFTADGCLRTQITQPRLELAKTGPETARLGEQAVFQLRLTNAGNGPALGVVLHDDLPDGLEHAAGTTIDAEIATLAPGETKLVVLTAKATKPGRHVNKASAWANNAAAVQAEAAVVVTEAALALKKIGPSERFVNREAEFVLEIANPGTAASTNVRVFDPIPQGLEFVDASDGGTYDSSSRTVTWMLGTVEPGAQRTLKVKVFGRVPGEYVNRATAQGDRGLEATSSAPLHVEGVPALLLEVVDLDDPVEVGAETTYEIRVFNQGSNPSTGLRILAAVPDGMIPESATGPAPYRVQGQQVIFEPLAKLAPRADALFRVRVKCKKAGEWRFKVQMNCDQFTLPVKEEESTRIYKD